MIKHTIQQILLLHLYSSFTTTEDLNKVVNALTDAVRAEVEEAIAVAIDVRFNGIRG